MARGPPCTCRDEAVRNIAALTAERTGIAWKKRVRMASVWQWHARHAAADLSLAALMAPFSRWMHGQATWRGSSNGFTTGARSGRASAGGPASTYEIDGQQYVAVVAGQPCGPSGWGARTARSTAADSPAPRNILRRDQGRKRDYDHRHRD